VSGKTKIAADDSGDTMQRLTREQSREHTREKLRLAAVSEFARCGFSGASIDRICEQAGFSRGAFYANFKSKEELLLDIVRTRHGQEADSWIALLSGKEGLDVLLPRLRSRFADYISNRELILFVVEVQLYARRNPEFASDYQDELSALSAKVEKMLEVLFRKAGRRPHRPMAVLATSMRGLVTGLTLDGDKLQDAQLSPASLLISYLEDLVSQGLPLGG